MIYPKMTLVLRVALLGLVLLAVPAAAWAQEIIAANTSRYIGDRRWEWTVYVQAPPPVLDSIRCVEYTLHSTFPDPVQRQCNRGNPRTPFGLTATGWRTFDIAIRCSSRTATSSGSGTRSSSRRPPWTAR